MARTSKRIAVRTPSSEGRGSAPISEEVRPERGAGTRRSHDPAAADGAKRQARGEARRQAILEAAIKVLAAKGQRGLRLTELAKTVGVTHPSLVYYFGNKDRLLREAVEERNRKERDFYSIPEEKLSLKGLPKVARQVEKDSLLTRLYVVLATENLDEGDVLHQFFVDRYRSARDQVYRCVLADQGRGWIRSDIDAEQLAVQVLATMMGLELQWLMDPEHFDYQGIMQRYTTNLLATYGPLAVGSL